MKKVTKKIEFASNDELDGVFFDYKTLIEQGSIDYKGRKIILSGEPLELRKVPKHKKNPFLFDEDDKLLIDVPVRVKKQFYVSKEYDDKTFYQTGEINHEEGGHYIYSKREVDPTEFIKVYTAGISAMYNLTKSGLKAFHYCTTRLIPDSDKIYIYIPDMAEFCGWKSKKQAYVGLKELIRAGIIAPSFHPGIWFINPQVIFNGNRLVLVRELRKKEVLPVNPNNNNLLEKYGYIPPES